MQGLCICIPTYKRANLLKLLLEDLARQSCRPETLIIVDGDPESNEVAQMMDGIATGIEPLTPSDGERERPRVRYVASGHANLAYQRYLGWRVAQEEKAEILLYLDDDLRLNQADATAELVAPLAGNEGGVVGCTARIVYPEDREGQYGKALADRAVHAKAKPSLLVRWFGSSRKVIPGSLSPSGHRCPPEIGSSKQTRVQWLRGGVMACRMDALSEDCFSHDLFGLAELGYGHGEDTLLSLRLAAKGELVFVQSAAFLHPCADAPKAYATGSRKMGFGVAYSRRLLNDNYRWPEDPRISDRIALLKSYLGTALLQWSRTLKAPKLHRFAYAWGYTSGAVKGIFSPPRAPRLTPGIDWASDAERTLAESRKMMETREKGEIKSKITIKNKSRSGKVLEAVN
jgi:glycosyltransferase involved in cell wall biosynthesis